MREILFRAKAINRIEGREYRTEYKEKHGEEIDFMFFAPELEEDEPCKK